MNAAEIADARSVGRETAAGRAKDRWPGARSWCITCLQIAVSSCPERSSIHIRFRIFGATNQ